MEPRSPSATGAWVSRRTVDLTVAAIAFAIGVIIMVDTHRLGAGWVAGNPQPGYFPFRIGAIISIVSALIGARTLLAARRVAPQVFVTWGRFRLVLAVLVPTLAYALAIQLVGIYVASALFIAGFMRLSGGFGWLRTAVTSIATSAVLFWMFEVQFLVPLPKGPLEALFGY